MEVLSEADLQKFLTGERVSVYFENDGGLPSQAPGR
jgi:hypothetical protein